MSRRRRYKIDPLTGIRYENGSIIDMTSSRSNYPFELHGQRRVHTTYPRYEQRRNQYYHVSQIYSEELPPWARLLLGVVLIAGLTWIFIIKPALVWIEQNIIPIIAVSAIIGFLVIKYETSRRAKKKAFEEEQQAKGLVKFIDRYGKEKWGTSVEVGTWKKEDAEEKIKESLYNRVIESIKKFTPSRRYGNEFGYHTELQGWLKSYFQNAVVELQTGASRPDIVIGNVAIEVKGPTDNQALNTLTTKCLKYSHYYTHLVIVLFEPIFSETNYYEIIEGLKKHFPNVEVIRKDYRFSL